MKPFWSYYGGKYRMAPHYPAPIHDTIVEPFAGAAGYSTRHHGKRVVLVDADPTIAGLWKYLIRTPATEILALPAKVVHVDEIRGPQEARWLVGFWLNKGTASPCKTPGRWMRDGLRPRSYWGPEIRQRIATQVDQIRHWTAIEGTWHDALRHAPAYSTWFIDPPYANAAGRRYRKRDVDHVELGFWCKSAQGQVIACENVGADWLPFTPFRVTRSLAGRHGAGHSQEAIWTNTALPTTDIGCIDQGAA